MRDTDRLLERLDQVEVPNVWSDVATRQPGPMLPPRRRHRAAAAAVAIAVFVLAGAFAWSAFRPGNEGATIGSADSTALIATLDAPEDGSIPGLTLAFGATSRDYFAEDGHWPGVESFDQPGFGFADPLPPGTSLMIAGDATHVEGDLAKFIEDNHSTADIPPIPLDLTGGSATLPTDPGRYTVHLTGTWPEGTAEFFVVLHVEPPSTSPSSSPSLGGEAVSPDFVVGGPPRDTVQLGWLPTGFVKRDDTVQTYANGAEIHSVKFGDDTGAIDVDAMRRPEGVDPRGDFFFPMHIDRISIGDRDVLVVTPKDPNGDLCAVEWQEGAVTIRLIGNHVGAETLVHVAENTTVSSDG